MSPTPSPINEQATLSNGGRTVTLRLPYSPATPSESGKEIVLSPERFQQLRTFLLSVEDIDIKGDEQFYSQFTKHTIDTIFSSYAAVQNRLLHHSQVLLMLQREADEWARKVELAATLLPEYKPVGWSGVWPLPAQATS